MVRPEPFRDLLEQALADGDVTGLDLRSRSGSGGPQKREPTRPDRPRYLSEDELFPSFPPEVFDDEPYELELSLDDTIAETLLPTKPFDLRPLAELSSQRSAPEKSEASLLHTSSGEHTTLPPLSAPRKKSKPAKARRASSPVPALEDLEPFPWEPEAPMPVAVGLSTSAWQLQHRGSELCLEPLVPVMPFASFPSLPTSFPAEGERHRHMAAPLPAFPARQDTPAPVVLGSAPDVASDGFSLEHLDALAGGATVDDDHRRINYKIEPNHRQRNTAESFYLMALEALGSRDKKAALTHLRTASALDPTVERYKLMIRDLEPGPALPVVRGKPLGR